MQWIDVSRRPLPRIGTFCNVFLGFLVGGTESAEKNDVDI
jgi:hypothetical protein